MVALWEPTCHCTFLCELERCPLFLSVCILPIRLICLMLTVAASIVIPSVLAFGKLLDSQWLPQRRRALGALTLWAIPQGACFIWIGIMYSRTQLNAGLDYEQYVLHKHSTSASHRI